MSLLTLIQELWRFFKDNVIRIIIGTIIIAALVVGGRVALKSYRPVQVGEDVTPEQVDASYKQLKTIYNQTPAEFKFIPTMEDGDVFANSYVFDEYFTSEDVLKELEKETGVKLTAWAKDEEVLNLTKSSDFRGGIAGIRDTSSGVITMRVQVGQNEEENLRVAQKIQSMLFDKGLPFTQHLNLSLIEPAQNEEWLAKDQLDYVSGPDKLSLYSGISSRSYIIYAVIGLVVGGIVMCGFTFIMQLYKRKITYAFDYSWDMDDQHLLLPLEQFRKDGKVQDFINIPQVTQRIIVSQSNPENLITDLLMPNGSSRIYVSELQELQNNPEVDGQVDEIVILIFARQTSKQWYREQAALANMYHTRIKIVHLY